MVAESSLPVRRMPTWRHMTSRIWARALAEGEGLAGAGVAEDPNLEIGVPREGGAERAGGELGLGCEALGAAGLGAGVAGRAGGLLFVVGGFLFFESGVHSPRMA